MKTLLFLALLPSLLAESAPPPDFRPLLENAVKAHAASVTIPPGVYRLAPRPGSSVHVSVHGASNLVINADGVTLVCEKLTQAVSFSHCQNVTLRGLTVDYDPLPFTQGKVVAIAPDFSSIDIALDAGYPRAAYSRIDLCDPRTRTRKRGMPFLWGTKAALVGPDTVRVTLKGIGKAAALGDLASLSTGPAPGCAPHGIDIGSCSGMVFENVTVYCAPGMGIIEHDGDGGMKFTGCRVVPGPVPPGATAPRLLSTSWDAMQSKTMKRGPLVERCEIRDAGDDSWSVQSSDYLVLSVHGSRALLGFRDEYCTGPLAGDRLALSLKSMPCVVTAVRPASRDQLDASTRARLAAAKPWSPWSVSGKTIEVTVRGAFPFAVGDSVYCPDRQGDGFVFRDNIVQSPGRVLIKAGHGVIENNTITNTHAGVTVCPEIPDGAAAGIDHLVIRGNRFAGTGHFCPAPWSTQAGCISITAGKAPDGSPEIRDVQISGNTFTDINGPSIVLIGAADVAIDHNTFDGVMLEPPNGTGRDHGIDGQALMWFARSPGVTVTDNHVVRPGPFLKTTVSGKNLDTSTLALLRAGITAQ